MPDITKYELSELENMTVQFGTTHVGKKFSTMWKEEQGWISWFVPRYNKSEKMDHRLMIRYIDLKVQEAENWNHKVPVTPSPKDVMKNKPMPKSLMQSKSKAKPGNKGYQMSMEDMDKETREEIEEIERAQWEALETGEDWDLHEMLRAGEPTRQDCLEADVQCLQNQTPEHGEHAAAGGEPHSSHREFRRSYEVEPLESWDALVAAGDIDGPECVLREPNQSKMHHRFHRLVHQISQELESTIQDLGHIKTKRVNLYEVFCGNQSRLTQQVQQLHGTAVRFSKDRTDLMTVEGRRVLFTGLGTDNPEHIWFAPECGPWSSWSNLNQMKSIELWDKIHHERMVNLEQLALGVVLLRYQRSQGRHFHLGTTREIQTCSVHLCYKSCMVKTVAAEFDMCNLGELTDPSTGKLIKKAMIVMTTSSSLHQALHGHHCKKNHEHQAIEGSTKSEGKVVSRSSYTENYPRKFVRYVAKVMLQKRIPTEKPVQWDQCEALVTKTVNPTPKRRRLTRVPTVESTTLKHSLEDSSQQENPPKRFRL